MQTRYATDDDIPRLIEIGHMAANEIGYYRVIDDEVLDNTLSHWIYDPEYSCRVVVNDDDIAVGGFISRISKTWFNTDVHAEGVAIYIMPEYRGRGGAVKLYKEFVEWVRGYPMIRNATMQTSSGLDLNRLITRCGFKKVGEVYRMEYDR